MVAAGAGVITTVPVTATCGHPPDADIVLVTVYVPGVLEAKSISPVAEFTKTSPGVDENNPATAPPVNDGEGLAAFEQ